MPRDGQDLGRVAADVQRWWARARRRADGRIAAWGERAGRRLWPELPFTIRLDHPPTADLRPRYGYDRPSHPGLEALLAQEPEEYARLLEGFSQYFDALARIPRQGEGSLEPCWIHPWLIGLDTVSLYCFVRQRRPAAYLEIGSGQSTKVVTRAVRDGCLPTRIISIDPAPRSGIDSICDRIIRTPLEQVDVDDVLGELRPGDVVFFDGSHRVLPNSDCVAFFLDILPGLPPGVLVGVHDVYLPDDYPDGFVHYWWSEQYVLAAILLAGGSRLRIVLPTFYASGRPELASLLAPLFGRQELHGVNPRGSAFWIETR